MFRLYRLPKEITKLDGQPLTSIPNLEDEVLDMDGTRCRVCLIWDTWDILVDGPLGEARAKRTDEEILGMMLLQIWPCEEVDQQKWTDEYEEWERKRLNTKNN
jgi:hypothetical protein